MQECRNHCESPVSGPRLNLYAFIFTLEKRSLGYIPEWRRGAGNSTDWLHNGALMSSPLILSISDLLDYGFCVSNCMTRERERERDASPGTSVCYLTCTHKLPKLQQPH